MGEPRYDLCYRYEDVPDGRPRIRISLTALPCPGVALRFNTLISSTPGEECRLPPITIDFVTNLPPAADEADPQSGGAPAPAAPQGPGQVVARRFTCSSGDFVLFSQLRRVEAMVAAAGLPPECAHSVNVFVRHSAASAINKDSTAVAITVEAGTPGSMLVEDDDGDEEDEVVPAGSVAEECAICYKAYVVGGATSMTLPCSHAFHVKCLDRWTYVNPTCPYCRAWVPEDHPDNDVPGEYEYRYGMNVDSSMPEL